MIDLRTAINCIKVQKKYGTYDGSKVGIVRSATPSHKEGCIVLFQEYESGLMIEIPLGMKAIRENKEKGSLITTIGAMIGVPKGCVEEVKLRGNR